MKGDAALGEEILLNIALFIPLGYFLSDALVIWNKRLAGSIAVGVSFIVAIMIELVQYWDGRGLCETDDVFNNVLGACLGIGICKICFHCIDGEYLQQIKKVLSIFFLSTGVVGFLIVACNLQSSPYKVIGQYDFDVTRVVTDEQTLTLQGYCSAYNRDTPSYQILLKGVTTGSIYETDTQRNGIFFQAVTRVPIQEKVESIVKFKGYEPMRSFTYINQNRVEYVSGANPLPDINDTNLDNIVCNGTLKAYEPDNDVYVYQCGERIYWLIGTPIDKSVGIIYMLSTNETERLPEHRRRYRFDNRSFRVGAKNELTGSMRCGKYRVFVMDIPQEYNVTAVTVGFYKSKKWMWKSAFRIKKKESNRLSFSSLRATRSKLYCLVV